MMAPPGRIQRNTVWAICWERSNIVLCHSREVTTAFPIPRIRPPTTIAIHMVFSRPSNDLPFSGERRTDARAYHGREESRAQARGVATRPALERAAQAFIRCNGLLNGTAGQITPARDNTNNSKAVTDTQATRWVY